MSRKRKSFTADFKAKCVLELWSMKIFMLHYLLSKLVDFKPIFLTALQSNINLL